MIDLREVPRPDKRSSICERVLRALPSWFGNEAATAHYIASVREKQLYAAFDGEEAVGFVALTVHNEYTAEIHVMGIMPHYHRQGIGRRLVEWAKARAQELNLRYLTVKTLADLRPDEGYARTRRFYESMGFVPLEVFETFWDEENPCLFLVVPVS